MEPNEVLEPVDATEELMNTIVENAVEEMQVRPTEVLVNIPYEELTEDEKKYLISALKTKNSELDSLAKRVIQNTETLKKLFDQDINKVEDTLTFIKTTAQQSYATILLAIKNLEREVRTHGN